MFCRRCGKELDKVELLTSVEYTMCNCDEMSPEELHEHLTEFYLHYLLVQHQGDQRRMTPSEWREVELFITETGIYEFLSAI